MGLGRDAVCREEGFVNSLLDANQRRVNACLVSRLIRAESLASYQRRAAACLVLDQAYWKLVF